MTFKELLSAKGFKENVDYSLSGKILIPLEKTRLVPDGDSTKDESYFEDVPTIEELMAELVLREDHGLMLNDYIISTGKALDPEDTINLALHMAGGNGWRTVKVPAPTVERLYEMIPATRAKTLAFKADNKDKENRRIVAIDKLKSFDKNKITTLAQIKEVVADIVDLLR